MIFWRLLRVDRARSRFRLPLQRLLLTYAVPLWLVRSGFFVDGSRNKSSGPRAPMSQSWYLAILTCVTEKKVGPPIGQVPILTVELTVQILRPPRLEVVKLLELGLHAMLTSYQSHRDTHKFVIQRKTWQNRKKIGIRPALLNEYGKWPMSPRVMMKSMTSLST